MQYGKFPITVCALVAVCAIVNYNLVATAAPAEAHKPTVDDKNKTTEPPKSHGHMMHSHLSRKVFDRACAASKDTIDEIIACITDNEALVKAVKPDLAAGCHKDAFGIDFDPKDINKHKEMICNNRDKFEQMTACVYRKMAESLDPKEMDKLTEAMVDVGLCIINALDG